VSRSVNVLDGEDGCAGPWPKYVNTPVKADVGLSHATEHGFDKVIDPLSCLARQIRESGLEGRVNGDRRGPHGSHPPACGLSSHKNQGELHSRPYVPKGAETPFEPLPFVSQLSAEGGEFGCGGGI
jgi:hypothetical protein